MHIVVKSLSPTQFWFAEIVETKILLRQQIHFLREVQLLPPSSKQYRAT